MLLWDIIENETPSILVIARIKSFQFDTILVVEL